ncbi:MAG: hypothetical protein PWP63_897, partial [Methanolobus sp.]|nr:hypothetical protein [Methanolobus sp.]
IFTGLILNTSTQPKRSLTDCYHTLFSRVLFSTETHARTGKGISSYHTLFSRVLFSTYYNNHWIHSRRVTIPYFHGSYSQLLGAINNNTVLLLPYPIFTGLILNSGCDWTPAGVDMLPYPIFTGLILNYVAKLNNTDYMKLPYPIFTGLILNMK